MKVLIVEDNFYKRDKIKYILEDTFSVEVDIALSFTSGWQSISLNSYDFICLDMSLPTFDQVAFDSGGEQRAFGGRELARKIKKKGLKLKFVIITQYKNFSDNNVSATFDVLRQEMMNDYPEHCLDVIFYNNKSSGWMSQLVDLIKGNVV